MINHSLKARIKLRHLTCFIETLRAGSLKGAADRLSLTQPAVSKTLKELEEILDAPLMTRSRAGIRLTEAGEVFSHFAEMSLSALDHGLDGLSALSEQSGRANLAIAALPSVAAGLLPRAVAEFERLSPKSSMRIVDGPITYCLGLLRDGAVDLALGRLGPPQVMQGISFTQLYQEDVVFVTRPGHPLTQTNDLRALMDWPVIYPPSGAAIRLLVDRLLLAHGISSVPHMIETVSGGFGRVFTHESDAVWIISRGVVWNELADGRLVKLPFDTSLTRGPVGLMRRSEAEPGPEEGLLVTALTKTIEKMGLA